MTVPESLPVLYSSPIQTQAPADQSPSELMMKSSKVWIMKMPVSHGKHAESEKPLY